MSTIGTRIDALHELREQKREYEEKIEELKDQMAALEVELLETLDSQGIDKAAGSKASISVSELIKPNVVDWDLFYKWIKKNNAFFMLERRPSVTACREVFETKGKIPGVVPFTKRSVNLRTR